MRKFLLWIGSMWVGMATLIVVVSILISSDSSNNNYNYDNSNSGGGASAFVSSVVVWLFALAFGLALSAPAFLNPPEDNGGIWSFRLPLPLWMFLMLLKLTSWVGFYILLGTWMLIFKVWTTHQNNRLPSFSNAPSQPSSGPQPSFGQPPSYGQPPSFGAQPVMGMPPASWQADPTGRYPHRWWDGSRWTDRVTNGNFQATDPL
jgi:hypothetical protein